MFRQRILRLMLPCVILASFGVATSALTDPEEASSLAERQLQVAREADDAIRAIREMREIVVTEQIHTWSRRLMEAEMAMSEKKADRIAAINGYLLRVKKM